MAVHLVVLAGVPIGRRVAAADAAAVQAHPEMDPGTSGLQAFPAAGDLARQGQNLDPIVVFTSRHGFPSLLFEHENRSLRRDNSRTLADNRRRSVTGVPRFSYRCATHRFRA